VTEAGGGAQAFGEAGR